MRIHALKSEAFVLPPSVVLRLVSEDGMPKAAY